MAAGQTSPNMNRSARKGEPDPGRTCSFSTWKMSTGGGGALRGPFGPRGGLLWLRREAGSWCGVWESTGWLNFVLCGLAAFE